MATTGLLAFAFAQVETEKYGELPTYKKGFFIDYPVVADVSLNYGDNPFYAGNAERNNDTDFTGGTITIGAAELGKNTKEAFTNENYMLGGSLDDKGNAETPTLYSGSGINSPYGGSGYVKTFQYPDNPATEYELVWYYRTRYTPTGESVQTRGSSTTWNNVSVSGKIYRVEGVDNQKNLRMRRRFASEQEAIAALKALANITEEASAAAGQTEGTE